MIAGLSIIDLAAADLPSAAHVFAAAIPDAFDKEGLGHLQADIQAEVEQKERMLAASLAPAAETHFLVAKLQGTVVGTVSVGQCNEDIRRCAGSQLHSVVELGSLYVLPGHQDQGIGSALIGAMMIHLTRSGVTQFCLDSGFRRAQQRWLRKFGAPFVVAKDYWGAGSDHIVWLCQVADFISGSGEPHWG